MDMVQGIPIERQDEGTAARMTRKGKKFKLRSATERRLRVPNLASQIRPKYAKVLALSALYLSPGQPASSSHCPSFGFGIYTKQRYSWYCCKKWYRSVKVSKIMYAMIG